MSNATALKQKQTKSKNKNKSDSSVFSKMIENIDGELTQMENTTGRKKKSDKKTTKSVSKVKSSKVKGVKKDKRLYKPCKLGKAKLKGILSIINEIMPDKNNTFYKNDYKADFTLSGKYAEELYSYQKDIIGKILNFAGKRTIACKRKILSGEDIVSGFKLYKEIYSFD